VRSFSESWVKKEISLKLQAAMQQDIIYLQRLKREAASHKPQAPSATKKTQLNNRINK
jgi:hypothetical protein